MTEYHKKRILVVDDNNDIRKMLRLMLEVEGYSVQDAASGDTAVQIIRTTPVDVVITDLIMPNIDGLEIIMELRKNYPGIRIIAITAGGRIGPFTYLDLTTKLGAALPYTKPFDQKEIVRAVRELAN